MRFTISRSSDEFMTVELPSPKYSPHRSAVWKPGLNAWVMEVENAEHLVELCGGKNIRLIITTGNDLPHVEIDDITLNRKDGLS